MKIPGLSELERLQINVDPTAINQACMSFQSLIGLRLFENFKTLLEAIDFTKATTKASKIGYKAPGQ